MRPIASLMYVILGGLVGGGLVWVLQGHSLRVLPESISYPDLIAVLLSGVSLLVAILGAGIAFFAIWGYTQFKKIVEKRTHDSVIELTPALLLNELREGQSRKVLINIVADFFANEESQPGVARAWNEERKGELADLKVLDEDAEQE